MFRRGGQLPGNLKFYYNGMELSIVESSSYLGVVFTPGGSFSLAQSTLAGQAPYLDLIVICKIETVHQRFCKRLLGVKKCTQNDFVYGELGRTSFQNNRFFMIIKYWLKIIVCNEAKNIRYIYNMMLEDMDRMPDKDNWASLVKKLLESLGFNDVWLAQGVGNVNLFLSLVKQRLHDQFIQNCNSRIQESSRANFYACVSSFQFRNYLKA